SPASLRFFAYGPLPSISKIESAFPKTRVRMSRPIEAGIRVCPFLLHDASLKSCGRPGQSSWPVNLRQPFLAMNCSQHVLDARLRPEPVGQALRTVECRRL